MATITQDSGKVIIQEMARGRPLVYLAIGVAGAGMVLCSGGFLAWGEGSFDTGRMVAATICGMGLIFFLSALGSVKMEFRWSLTLSESGAVFTQGKRQIDFLPGDFRGAALHRVADARRDSTRQAFTYQIFLIRSDGARFWLLSTRDKTECARWIAAISDGLGLPIKDHTELGLDRPGTSGDVDLSAPPAGRPRYGAHSRYTTIQETPEGLLIAIRRSVTLLGTAILGLVMALFIGAPAGFAILSVRDTTGGDPVSRVTTLALMIPFLSLFVLAAVAVMLLMTKRYLIHLRSDVLSVRLELGPAVIATRLPWLLTREKRVDRDAIKRVRVDRLEQGNFRLSLALASSNVGRTAKSSLTDFLFNAGAFRAAPEPAGEHEAMLGLWEIAGWTRPEDGASAEDLFAIEEAIERRMRLDG